MAERARVGTLPWRQLGARQVNLLLEVAIVTAIATGLTSWAVGTGWSRWWTFAHAVAGLTLLVLAGSKYRRSVRPGMRRGRLSRWLSVAFGVGVLAVVVLGLLHSTGSWWGVGYWSALWTHFLLAFCLVPLLVWHVTSRPSRPRAVDLDRRLLLGGGAAVGAAAVLAGTVEVAERALGVAGADRRFTGSHEIGSFDPARMPTVSWIDDESPDDVDPATWPLVIAGRDVAVADLVAVARPVAGRLDCTGGWWSEQSWDAVPLSELIDAAGARSIRVRSVTGYERLVPARDAASTYLAVGYGGEPLRRGHGAPVRLVAPSRRGPWWIKWVVAVELDDRPWWFQVPFPTT
ncbi:molybdopterin-dependent oxidoreductase [Actinomarinicola tropica]|nr:molybdopterin-dependent oxidoreductase [Actinomarinicola tropica]